MYNVVLLTRRDEDLAEFIQALSTAPDVTLKVLADPDAVLELVRSDHPHLVILDQGYEKPLDLVVAILTIDAMVNTTMITSMDAETWHEKSEGLGMMEPVPDPPAAIDADALLTALRGMPGLS